MSDTLNNSQDPSVENKALVDQAPRAEVPDETGVFPSAEEAKQMELEDQKKAAEESTSDSTSLATEKAMSEEQSTAQEFVEQKNSEESGTTLNADSAVKAKSRPKDGVLGENVEAHSNWQCESSKIETELNQLNVGSKFRLTCKGEGLDSALAPNLYIGFEQKPMSYTLNVLDVEVNEFNQVQMVVTGYRPGDFKHSFYITDNKKNVRVDGLQWTVNSVINPKEKPPTPFAGYLMGISYPVWLWVMLAIFIAIVIGFFTRFFMKINQRKKLQEKLREYRTALSPFNQFNKDLRLLMRKISFAGQSDDYSTEQAIKDIENEFNLYLVRELVVPALEWKMKPVIAEISRVAPGVMAHAGKDIKKVMSEFQKAHKSLDKMKWSDCEQLAKMARNTVTKINEARRLKK